MDEVPATGAVFTEDDLLHRRGGERLVKHDAKRERTIAYQFNPFSGHCLEIWGRGVPGHIAVTCHGDFLNVVACVLLKATYDGNLIGLSIESEDGEAESQRAPS